jgi:hypothetical protein
MVQGAFSGRAAMRTCLVNAIEQIRLAKATALWALKVADPAGSPSPTAPPISTVDLIKYLTAQALCYGPAPTERSLALSCARFQSARGEKEWANLLAAGLAELKRVFIVADIELLSSELACSPQEAFTLPESLAEVFALLKARAPGVVVKVLLASYGSPLFGVASEPARRDLLLAGKARPQRVVASRAGRRASGLRAGRGQLRRGFGFERTRVS